MNKTYFIITTLFFFWGCNLASNKKPDYANLNLEELFNSFLTTQDTIEEMAIIPYLDDSIPMYQECFFYQYERVDSNLQNQSFYYCMDKQDVWECVKTSSRNQFVFQISCINEITVNNDSISSLDYIRQEMVKFLLNMNNQDDLPEKRIREIDLLGAVSVSKGAFIINAQMIADSTNTHTDWAVIKRIIKNITETLLIIRNESAIKFWDKEYSKLSFQEMKAIRELHPLGIWFYPNRYFPKPPPPPPPPSDKVQEMLTIIGEDVELE